MEGLRIGNIANLTQAFHKESVMYGLTNGKLLGGPIKSLYDFVEKNGTAADIGPRLDVLAITPTTAIVRVDMENDAIGADYTTSTRLSSSMAHGTSSPRFITCMKCKGSHA